MTTESLAQWTDDFEAFHARFAHLFTRSEPRKKAVKYLRGLMAQVDRKNCWQLAEAVGDQTPDAMQRLLYKAKWMPMLPATNCSNSSLRPSVTKMALVS